MGTAVAVNQEWVKTVRRWNAHAVVRLGPACGELLNCDWLPRLPVMESSGASVSGPSATLTLSDSASRRISPCCHSSFFLWAHDRHVWQTHALPDARLRIADHIVLRVHVSRPTAVA